MQALQFETAWDKTIAPADRKNIEWLFEDTKNNYIDNIVFLPIRQDYNHRQDLLIIVLLHNFTDQPFSFGTIDLAYWEKDKLIAAHHFSFRNLTLPAKTSMPWTFIFPKAAQKAKASFENGKLIIP